MTLVPVKATQQTSRSKSVREEATQGLEARMTWITGRGRSLRYLGTRVRALKPLTMRSSVD